MNERYCRFRNKNNGGDESFFIFNDYSSFRPVAGKIEDKRYDSQK